MKQNTKDVLQALALIIMGPTIFIMPAMMLMDVTAYFL